MTDHAYYNRANFPRLVCRHGNWNIYANSQGYCAAIPTAEAAANGCRASHFGDANYVRATLGVEVGAPAPRHWLGASLRP